MPNMQIEQLIDISEIERELSKKMIKDNVFPKLDEYVLGDISYKLTANSYKIRDEPLFMFKKNSRFRNWCEDQLKKYDLFNDYTILFVNNIEWFSSLSLIKKDRFDCIEF